MAKYHIDKNGKPSICKATKQPCPLGGDDVHFGSSEEAQAYIDQKSAAKHGFLSVYNASEEGGDIPYEVVYEGMIGAVLDPKLTEGELKGRLTDFLNNHGVDIEEDVFHEDYYLQLLDKHNQDTFRDVLYECSESVDYGVSQEDIDDMAHDERVDLFRREWGAAKASFGDNVLDIDDNTFVVLYNEKTPKPTKVKDFNDN